MKRKGAFSAFLAVTTSVISRAGRTHPRNMLEKKGNDVEMNGKWTG